MSICQDDSYLFLKKINYLTLKKLKTLKTLKRSYQKKSKSLKKQTILTNDDWLKRYIYEKASELVESNYQQFINLHQLFHSIRLDDFNIINPLQIKYHIPVRWMIYNLETELKKYPNRYLPYENRVMIINSLTENRTSVYTSFNLKYSFNNIMGLENIEANIVFNCKFKDAIRDGSQYVNNIIYSMIKIIGFYVKYLISKHKFTYKLPNLVIYFTDINKCLKEDGDVLGFSSINSAFYYGNGEDQELVIYRRQELF